MSDPFGGEDAVRKSAKKERRRWLGGYVRGGVFIIERWIRGVRYHVSTHAKTERGALEQLRLFEAAPTRYDPGGGGRPAGVVMTAELIDAYLRWAGNPDGLKRNSPGHVAACGAYLGAWMVALDGADLRTVSGAQLSGLLGMWGTATRYRAIALKGFFRWLRVARGALRHHEDGSLDLAIPKPRDKEQPEALRKEVVEATLLHLGGVAREVVALMGATGLHLSEVRRFSEGVGRLSEPTPQQKRDGVVANLSVKHKTGPFHVVPILDEDVAEAARRLREAGGIGSRFRLNLLLAKAALAAGVQRWTIGQLRPAVATWLALEGVPLAQVAELLGHRSPETTRKFYRRLGHTAAPLRVPRLRLVR